MYDIMHTFDIPARWDYNASIRCRSIADETYGHIVYLYKNTKNELSVYDAQNGINTRGNDAVLEYLKKVRPFTIKLLDVENCDISVNAANEILRGAKK